MDPLTSPLGSGESSFSLASTGTDTLPQAPQPLDPYQNEEKLLELFKTLKTESTEYRWVWEREFLRDLYYVIGRQWIFFSPTRREWVDKRLAKWIPRPVTNKMSEIVQAIRSTFQAINLAIVARPVGDDTESIAAAEITSDMAPLIHEQHRMDQVMREADFWLITTGNAVLQISWDKDFSGGQVFIQSEQCAQCGAILAPQDIVGANHTCPQCGGAKFTPAPPDPSGQPAGQTVTFGQGKTTALSPFEFAFPSNITRWDDLPYIIRLRWRDKHWFERNRPELVPRITWEKSPQDRSLQIFKSLALTNDIGTGSQFAYLGAAGSHTVEGVTEYELWMKPSPDYPKGLVMRVLGDQSPILLQSPEESLPGPLPFTDIKGVPLFPFVHAQYEHMGGRLYGRSAISPLVQKQDQLNQLDSLIQLIVQRMANPVWIVPEGAGIEHFTGEPGLVMKWNPLAAGGQGKPDRIPGSEVPATLYELREQLLKDIEDLSGAFDILKGQKPTGVEAFSALQLLVERSQSRFTSVFKARGEMYRQWFAIAIELEREFGPQERVWAVVEPNKGYSFEHFKNAQLQGQVNFAIEDGTNMPRTSLGKRAAIEQASQMMLLNPNDPDQKYALLENFGLTDLVPSLNTHVQTALTIQDQFEKWAQNPVGPSPLQIKPWYNVEIHLNERIKWLNTDRMRQILAANPALEMIVTQHLQQLQMLLAPPPMPGPGGPGGPTPGAPGAPGHPEPGSKPGGGGMAMKNSNSHSAAPGSMPHGNASMGPNVGPA
jgi:hypothetical protein